MKIEYVYGCTCDSLTIDGVETVNMDIKDVRDCVLNIISKTNDLSLLQSILSDVAELDGEFNLQVFITTFGTSIINPFGTFGKVFAEGAGENFVSTLLVVTVIYTIFFFIGFVRSAPKNEYSDIEHGSSDWSQRGEQYTVLSKNKGIILAEDNYLPLDKRGNINVLVVGRIRVW